MAVSQSTRILDLLLGGHTAQEITILLDVTEADVEAAAQDLTVDPSTSAITGLTATALSVGATTIDASGNTDVNGTLGVDGIATFDAAINAASASIAGTTIAASTGNTDINGTLGVDGAATIDGALAVGGDTSLTGKLGVNGATPAAQGSAYTQTYSTAARTVPVATVAGVATTGSTTTTPYGYGSAAQADAIPVAINALAADVLALKKVINALVDDLQAVGISG